jgi:SAM-dependent methyltransferase
MLPARERHIRSPDHRGDLADLYRSGAYCEMNPELHAGDSPGKVQHILTMLHRRNLSPRSVCEVGCGAGRILALLQPHLAPESLLHGYDIAPRAVELCRQLENERLRYFCRDLPEADREPYDLLLCIDVVEHVPDYIGFLASLRARGVFKIFHIPLEMCARYAAFSGPILTNRSQAGHLHYFNRETALATLRDTGYEVVDWFYTPAYKPHLPTAGRRERLLRMLFRFVSDDLNARVLGGYSLLVLAK